jgi:hypothetical protein
MIGRNGAQIKIIHVINIRFCFTYKVGFANSIENMLVSGKIQATTASSSRAASPISIRFKMRIVCSIYVRKLQRQTPHTKFHLCSFHIQIVRCYFNMIGL